MSILKQVTPSGTVGKQVYAETENIRIRGAILTASTSAATLVIRDGNASGEVILTMKAGVNDTVSTPDCIEQHLGKGLHAKVTPANALAYLMIE